MKPLNPIMAVLAIASVGAFPLRAFAADGSVIVTVPAGVPVAVEDTNSITKLTSILDKNAAAKVEAGRRVADFLLLPDAAGKSFVAKDVGAKELRAVASDWASKQTAGNLAMLYFVVGVGPKAPDWVKNDELLKKTVLPKREAEDRLRKALSRFTEAAGAQITKAKEKDDATAFLNTASAEAKKIFDNPASKADTDASVEGNNNTGVKAPDTTAGSGAAARLGASTQQYTLKDLYEDGAEVMNIAGPKDQNSRRISVKMYSTRDEKTGEIINEIGIFDITDKNDIFGQRFPLGSGDQSFILDDRTPGHKKYELKFDKQQENGDRAFTFGRPGADTKDPKAVITTSINKLLVKRASQAEAMSNIVRIGTEDFYALPQGGEWSVLNLFPKAAVDARSVDNARALKPALHAEVGTRGTDGTNQNVPRGANGGPELGELNGKPYHLEFNTALRAWEIKEGPGNKPVRPPKPAATGDGTAAGGGGTTGNTGDGTTTTPSGGRPIAELEALLLAAPHCKKQPEDTAKLAEALKDKFGLVTCNKTNKPEDLEVYILVPASVRKEQQLMYSRLPANGAQPAMNLLRGRMVDRYLVLQFDKQVHYLDMLKPSAGGFEMAGFVTDEQTGQDAKSGFKDIVPFMDALRNYAGIKGADTKALEEVPGRVAKIGAFTYIKSTYRAAPGGRELVVDGAASGGHFEVWPKFTPVGVGGDTGPAASQYQSLSGPANAMDGSVGSVDAPIQEEISLDKSMKGKAIHRTADIAIYKTVDPTGKSEPNQYLVMFRYDALDPKDPANPDGPKEKKTFRQKQFEVFNSSNPLPSNLGYEGLVGKTVIKDRVASGYRFVKDTNATRGVLAVFQEKQVSGDNAKDTPANCVGPIVWWGLKDRDAALEVCKNDKF